MKFPTLFVLLAALATAAPAPVDDFSVGEKLRRDLNLDKVPLIPSPHAPNITRAYYNAYRKYHGKFPVIEPFSSTGSVNSQVVGPDSLWSTPTQIGTPPQTLNLDFDTGSADLWVISTGTTASDAAGHNIYNPSKSSTWTPISGSSWSITYGDKSNAHGTVGTDVVSVGGVSVSKQGVEVAATVSKAFADDKSIDGLLGLGYDNGNTATPKQKTFISNLKGVLPAGSQLFTTALYGSRTGKQSYWTWGYVDQNLLNGNSLSWTTVNTINSFWQFPITRTNVNGKDYTRTAQAIADTGTTLLLLDSGYVQNWYKSIPGASYDIDTDGSKFWYFPNSQLSKLPTFKIDVGGKLWTVQPSDLIFVARDASTTYGSIQENGGIGINILGDSFLKSVYAVWDYGNTRLGLVPKIEAVQNLNPPSGN